MRLGGSIMLCYNCYIKEWKKLNYNCKKPKGFKKYRKVKGVDESSKT